MPRVKELLVNGSKRVVNADSSRTLLSVLRDDLDLTGSKYGRGESQCGVYRAARRPAHPRLHHLRRRRPRQGSRNHRGAGLRDATRTAAFLEVGALQCGYCTPA
ncbi:MAG: hypothetical protein U0736_27870 [Gemmataceae bacterium]